MLIAEEVPTLEYKNSCSRNVVDIPPMQVFCIGENGKNICHTPDLVRKGAIEQIICICISV